MTVQLTVLPLSEYEPGSTNNRNHRGQMDLQ